MQLFFKTVKDSVKNKVSWAVQESRMPMWAWFLIIVLFITRLILPFIGLWSINWVLSNKMGNYDGHIDAFGLSLFRGAYQIHGLEIRKKNLKAPPLLKIKDMELSLAWRAFLRKEVTGDITIDEAEVYLIDSKEKQKQQLGADEPNLKETFSLLIPITIESLKIHRSNVNFSNTDLSKTLPARVTDIEFSAEDLRSHTDQPAEALSPFIFKGLIQDHAAVKADGILDILTDPPRADINFSIVKFHPKTANQLLLTYLPLDLTEGELSIYGEAATSHGEIKGYVNVFLKDVDVIAASQNFISTKHFFYEILSAFGNWLLQNNKTKMVAVHIPFKRAQGKFDINTSEAFWSALKNKSQELKPGFENSISLSNIESKADGNN